MRGCAAYERSKQSYIFRYKQDYIHFVRIGRHLGCAKRQLENRLVMFATLYWKRSQVDGKFFCFFVFFGKYLNRERFGYLNASQVIAVSEMLFALQAIV